MIRKGNFWWRVKRSKKVTDARFSFCSNIINCFCKGGRIWWTELSLAVTEGTQSVLGKSLMMSHNFRIYYFLKVLQYHIFLTKL